MHHVPFVLQFRIKSAQTPAPPASGSAACGALCLYVTFNFRESGAMKGQEKWTLCDCAALKLADGHLLKECARNASTSSTTAKGPGKHGRHPVKFLHVIIALVPFGPPKRVSQSCWWVHCLSDWFYLFAIKLILFEAGSYRSKKLEMRTCNKGTVSSLKGLEIWWYLRSSDHPIWGFKNTHAKLKAYFEGGWRSFPVCMKGFGKNYTTKLTPQFDTSSWIEYFLTCFKCNFASRKQNCKGGLAQW